MDLNLSLGKLKVLPEQPEPPEDKDKVTRFAFLKDHDESVGTAGDSDEGDVDEDSDEPEDVEVRAG